MQIHSQSIKQLKCLTGKKLFQNKNIHDQLKLLNETIVNIVSNYIPNKFIICNDKDSPWLNDHIKRLINLYLKKYLKDWRPKFVYENLQTITWDLTEAVSSSKKVYYERLANKLKLFADDTSLFSVIHDVDISSATLNNDLVKIKEWAYNWKIPWLITTSCLISQF